MDRKELFIHQLSGSLIYISGYDETKYSVVSRIFSDTDIASYTKSTNSVVFTQDVVIYHNLTKKHFNFLKGSDVDFLNLVFILDNLFKSENSEDESSYVQYLRSI